MERRGMIKKIAFIVVGLVVGLIIIGSLVGDDARPSQSTSNQTREAAATKEPTPTPKDVVPLVAGGIAENKDYKLTLVEWTDPFQSPNQFSKPKDGNRWIVTKVLIETTNTGKVGAAGSYFKVKDTDGYQYDSGLGVLGDNKPTLS